MRKQIGSLWRQTSPKAYTREESRARIRALTRLAHEVAHGVRTGSIRKGKESLRIAINRLMRDDESLRLLGFSECDRAMVLNAALSLLTNEGRR